MHTSETAPRDYTGPIRLNAAQVEQANALHDAWTQALIAQARDESDPETQGNAQSLLRNRDIAW